ncbi:MAG: hypothetical protein ACE5ES_06165, partial [Candidatus Nanoarchaeia archaeon]
GYFVPVGVWQIRENVRSALSKKHNSFDSKEKALSFALSKCKISLDHWKKSSTILKSWFYQKRISDYFAN